MTLRQLAELSALVALHGDQWIVLRRPLSDLCLGQYLQAAKQRQLGWRTALQRATASAPEGSSARSTALLDLLAEVLITEMLTRLWTAVLTAGDAWQGTTHCGPVARHVLGIVLESRTQLLSQLLQAEASPLGTLLEADRLTRKFERWTDLLIGELALQHDVIEFAVDRGRAGEFRDQNRGATVSHAAVTWKLLCAGLQRAAGERATVAETVASHQSVMQSILITLPQTPLDLERRFRLPTGWPIRKAIASADLLPLALSARLTHGRTLASPSGALADLLRRLEGQIPPDSAAGST